jgi:diguanylate cyclase (GGDEF)-like protein
MEDNFAAAPMTPESEAATRTLALLNAQADALRTDIAALRRELARTQREGLERRATRVAEADEELVSAAVHADSVAQTAANSLDEFARFNQHDELTGAPNRALMFDRLEHALSLARRRQTRVGVLFVDLDHFKQINDSLGHAAGDQVLQAVTGRLQSAVRSSDTVSRHSGDEFVVLLAEIIHAADAAPIARKMLAALAMPCRIGPHTLSLTASVGIAVFPEDGGDGQTLIHHADAAMYRSKKLASGGFEFHKGEQAAEEVALLAISSAPTPAATAVDSAFAEHEARLRELLQANHQLVTAAKTSQKWKADAEEAHSRQIKFVAMAAHAMRNPLAVIQMTADVMSRAEMAAQTRRPITIKRQASLLARLIDDLLDGSLVGTGEFRLQTSDVEIDEILNLAIDTCRHAMDGKKQQLQVHPGGPGAIVHADSVRLSQVFSNLLQNASRRAPVSGEVSVKVNVLGDELLVTVSETEVGIAPESLPNIFDLFVVDNNVPVDDAGLGIGLAVARELVVAHGGSISAKSGGSGLGSEFLVTLPLARPPAPASESAA